MYRYHVPYLTAYSMIPVPGATAVRYGLAASRCDVCRVTTVRYVALSCYHKFFKILYGSLSCILMNWYLNLNQTSTTKHSKKEKVSIFPNIIISVYRHSIPPALRCARIRRRYRPLAPVPKEVQTGLPLGTPAERLETLAPAPPGTHPRNQSPGPLGLCPRNEIR